MLICTKVSRHLELWNIGLPFWLRISCNGKWNHCFAMVAMVAMVPHRMAVLAFAMASAAPEAPALRGAPGADLRSSWQHAGCCNGCNTAFCSPQSGSCYDYKGKYYYLECGSGSSPQGSLPAAQPHADCCDSCSGSSYCSPASGTCYASKGRDYYLECAGPRPDFVKVANYACTTSVQSETFYDLLTCFKQFLQLFNDVQLFICVSKIGHRYPT